LYVERGLEGLGEALSFKLTRKDHEMNLIHRKDDSQLRQRFNKGLFEWGRTTSGIINRNSTSGLFVEYFIYLVTAGKSAKSHKDNKRYNAPKTNFHGPRGDLGLLGFNNLTKSIVIRILLPRIKHIALSMTYTSDLSWEGSLTALRLPTLVQIRIAQ
jgi:hypothetical protein